MNCYDALAPWYDSLTGDVPYAAIADFYETEFAAVLSDYASDNAKTWIAYDGKTPVGYLCGNDSGMVFELLAQNEAGYAALLKHIERDAGKTVHALIPTDSGLSGERLHSMQYLVFDNAFALPLKNGYCRIAY